MGKDLEGQTYEERVAARKQHAKEVMGEATPENFMRAAQDHALAAEYRDLTEWFTDAYDEALLDAYHADPAAPSAALQSFGRRGAANSDPAKFKRLREVEAMLEKHAQSHRNLANAQMTTITRQGLEAGWP